MATYNRVHAGLAWQTIINRLQQAGFDVELDHKGNIYERRESDNPYYIYKRADRDGAYYHFGNINYFDKQDFINAIIYG